MSAHEETEIWRPIPDYPGYEASSFGNLRSWRSRASRGPKKTLTKPFLIKPWCQGSYLRAGLRDKDGKKWLRGVHQLVAAAFYGECPYGLCTAHENGNPHDNRPSNLRYKTDKENMADKIRHGTSLIGERNCNAVLTAEDVKAILESSEGLRVLGERYGVHLSTIWLVRHRKNWKHV